MHSRFLCECSTCTVDWVMGAPTYDRPDALACCIPDARVNTRASSCKSAVLTSSYCAAIAAAQVTQFTLPRVVMAS